MKLVLLLITCCLVPMTAVASENTSWRAWQWKQQVRVAAGAEVIPGHGASHRGVSLWPDHAESAMAVSFVSARQSATQAASVVLNGHATQRKWLAGLNFGRTIKVSENQDVLTVICPIDTAFLWILGVALCFTLVVVGRTGSLRKIAPWVLILLIFGVIAGVTTSNAEVVLNGPEGRVDVTTVLFFRATHNVFPLTAFLLATVSESDQSDALRLVYQDGSTLQLTPFNQQHGKSQAAYAVTQFLNRHQEAAAYAETMGKVPAVTWGPGNGRLNIALKGRAYALALSEGLVQFCDAGGGHSIDLHSGLVRTNIADCKRTEPAFTCTAEDDTIEVRTPNLEGEHADDGDGPPLGQDDIIDVNGESFPMQGHVHDCTISGSIMAAATSQQIILVDLKTSKAIVTLPFGSNWIALGDGYLAWADAAVHTIPITR